MPIRQEIRFNAPPATVYRVLTDPTAFAEMTGEGAVMQAVPGTSFSQFDGKIIGVMVEATAGEALVQVWRAMYWPPHHYSLAYYEFLKDGEGTKLVFDHVGFPPDARAHLEEGWHKMVWGPLAAFLAR